MEDLKESIAEMDEMEQLRIESELEKQQQVGAVQRQDRVDHRDSGMGPEVGLQEVQGGPDGLGLQGPLQGQGPGLQGRLGTGAPHQNGGGNLKRGAINNSLLDLVTDSGSVLGFTTAGFGSVGDKPNRRGSVGSLDSGMSVSFQSGSAGSAGTVSQESSPQQLAVKTGTVHCHGLPNPRPRKLSAGNQSTNL